MSLMPTREDLEAEEMASEARAGMHRMYLAACADLARIRGYASRWKKLAKRLKKRIRSVTSAVVSKEIGEIQRRVSVAKPIGRFDADARAIMSEGDYLRLVALATSNSGVKHHPMQPVVFVDGVARFRENPIVRHLLDEASAGRRCDMNDLARVRFDDVDREHFAQLIGYSVSGASSLDYVSDGLIDAADEEVKRLMDNGAGGESARRREEE